MSKHGQGVKKMKSKKATGEAELPKATAGVIENDKAKAKKKGLYFYVEACPHDSLTVRDGVFGQAINFKKFIGAIEVINGMNTFQAIRQSYELSGSTLEDKINDNIERLTADAEAMGYTFEERADSKGNPRFGWYNPTKSSGVLSATRAKLEETTAKLEALTKSLKAKGMSDEEIAGILGGQ
jgi:hypothetical protein